MKYIFDIKKERYPSRAYLWNISKNGCKCRLVNSLIPKKFAEFIHEAISKNEKKYVMKKCMKVNAKPEFITLLKTLLCWLASMSFLIWLTGDKGRFYHLVSSYRKRKLHEMESDVNKEEYKELTDKSLKEAEFIAELNEFQDLALNKAENIGKLARLFELGVIDKDNEYWIRCCPVPPFV